jgi:DNA-binding MarR family transcriptional regulator
MAADDPGALIGAAIERLVLAASRARSATAVLMDLSPTDLLALRQIGQAGEMSPGSLAEALLLSPSGTTGVIKRLGAAGLLARVPGPGNQRHVRLHLTAEGERAIAPFAAPLQRELDALARALPIAERARLEELLAQLADVTERDADRLVREGAAAARAARAVPPPILWG